MMTKRIQMAANNNFLHLRVGVGLPFENMEAGPIREQATRFYWGIFQLLNKETGLLQDDQQARVLRLSFDDDFGDEGLEEDDFEEDDLLTEEDSFKEEEDLVDDEEDEEDLKDELFYK